MAGKKKSVLFICLGNICRSPMAEAVFCYMLQEKGIADQWDVDSAALGPWHVGKGPDGRTMQVLKNKGINNYEHRARTLTKADYTHYDVIFGMDDDNMSELKSEKPKNSTTRLERLGSYDPRKELTIRDPYYDSAGDLTGFEDVYVQCVRCCTAYLNSCEAVDKATF